MASLPDKACAHMGIMGVAAGKAVKGRVERPKSFYVDGSGKSWYKADKSGLNPLPTAKGGRWRPRMDETDGSGLWEGNTDDGGLWWLRALLEAVREYTF
jgi:hypothetical protein